MYTNYNMFRRSKRLLCFASDIALESERVRRYCAKVEPYLETSPRAALLVTDKETRNLRNQILYGSKEEKKAVIRVAKENDDPRAIYVIFMLAKHDAPGNELIVKLAEIMENNLQTKSTTDLEEIKGRISNDKSLSYLVMKVGIVLFTRLIVLRKKLEEEVKKFCIDQLRSELMQWIRANAKKEAIDIRATEERIERQVLPAVSKALDVLLQLPKIMPKEQMAIMARRMVLDNIGGKAGEEN